MWVCQQNAQEGRLGLVAVPKCAGVTMQSQEGGPVKSLIKRISRRQIEGGTEKKEKKSNEPRRENA